MQSGTAEKGMGGFPLFFIVTTALTIGFAVILSTTSLEAIKENWDENRCNLGVMFLAGFLKPASDTRSSTQFATDNFSYCSRRIAKEGLLKAFAPFLAVLKKQMDGMSVFTQAMNNIRSVFQNSVGSFNTLLKERYTVFVATYVQFKRVFERLQQAFSKINAMVVSSIYIGISMMLGMKNMYDFVIKVVKIIMIILIALVIILFLFFAPLLVIIIATVGALAGAGVSVAGSGAFCLSPETQVQMKDGTWKRIDSVELGEHLWTDSEGENVVEGVLVADGSSTPLYSIHGIMLSGAHRVAYRDIWLLARDHPKAVQTNHVLPRLYCLNTSHHKVFCKSLEPVPLLVSDWEEVSTDEGGQAWISLVNRVLNGPHVTSVIETPSNPSILGSGVRVRIIGGEWAPIESLKIGDTLYDESSILSIYKGQIHTSKSKESPDWISDGVWIWNESTHSWAPKGQISEKEESYSDTIGYSLITDSGEYTIRSNDQVYRVRDFTELGISNLELSYPILDDHLSL